MKRGTFSLVAVSSLICFFLNYFGGLSTEFFHWTISRLGYELISTGSSPSYNLTGNIGIALYTLVIAPITEELFCRGLLLNTLKKSGYTFAILCSSFLFAMLHGNVSQLIPSFLVGILLSYIALRTSSLLPGILIHMINNSLVFLLNLFTSSLTYPVIHLLILTIALMGFLFLLFSLFFERNRLKNLSYCKAPKKCYLWFFTSFFILLNILFYGTILFSALHRL